MSPIDTQALESLLDMLEGDEESLAEIINCYLVESPKIFIAIQASVTNQDANTLQKTAHKLKSSSASLGAMNLHQLCLELESKGRSGNLEGVVELVSQLVNEYAQVEIALKKIVQVS
ncbi:Hpt domain-containing protein [Anabaena sp. UHCC 0187]|uniref:Hpt domain-containing protein n=1 Tax=Anabaena sp. UHCC 0187 TaxID=2590018 RepID=UPI0014473E67|nr:Hpt domain-containing protein [Anabaena sp. UHCC 0187]MDP5018026.1 Hpt domain-containing protein [Dolichospermum sp.]MTJ12332.1 Hpt domain-containing protein [Anabaena sp. UHCC 0187]